MCDVTTLEWYCPAGCGEVVLVDVTPQARSFDRVPETPDVWSEHLASAHPTWRWGQSRTFAA
jgi:hypothetical protein